MKSAGVPFHQSLLPSLNVSSVLVVVIKLEEYPIIWLVGPHVDPDSDNCGFGRIYKVGPKGPLEDGDSEGEIVLIRCCATNTPREVPALLLEASQKSCINVHENVTPGHPCL